ncbi:hypothetical protein Y1Q_0008283 [Alligator mississippiensis]|uniref:Uncharacterized protein n=1 Tax=Alligator mississippiensis TaxID=8496 RepID=A0A151N1K2_ALLMI|nr:hypothetical protein Y1Q_0008283 [Alligator mississippiensis]
MIPAPKNLKEKCYIPSTLDLMGVHPTETACTIREIVSCISLKFGQKSTTALEEWPTRFSDSSKAYHCPNLHQLHPGSTVLSKTSHSTELPPLLFLTLRVDWEYLPWFGLWVPFKMTT